MEKDLLRHQLYSLLGELPDRNRPITCTQIFAEEHEHYIVEKLLLDLNGFEDVPAYFVRHKQFHEKRPVILFNHSHGGKYSLGKDELIAGNTYMYDPPYAEELTRMGYSVLSIDSWGFGERSGRTESTIFKEMLWKGQVLWGMMVYDNLRALDYLTSRPDVDTARIGTLGMSMGSTMAWWVAALDPRIKVCIDICCLTDFQALIDSDGLDEHGIYYYVPKLLKYFTAGEINALISPRAHLSLAGNFDRLTPVDGLERIDAYLKDIYAAESASQAWKLIRYDCEHIETAEMRQEIIHFLKNWL